MLEARFSILSTSIDDGRSRVDNVSLCLRSLLHASRQCEPSHGIQGDRRRRGVTKALRPPKRLPDLDGAGLLALQLLVGRRSTRATSDVDNVHYLLAVIDSEEDSVDVRLPPIAQHSDRSTPIGTLSGHGTALWVRIQRQHRPLETIEPLVPCWGACAAGDAACVENRLVVLGGVVTAMAEVLARLWPARRR